MVDDDSGVLRTVAWSEIFPWLSLFRCFRLATQLRVLIFSAVAAFLMVCGWMFIAWVFSGGADSAETTAASATCPWTALTDLVPDKPGLRGDLAAGPAGSAWERWGQTVCAPMIELSRPARGIFQFREVTAARFSQMLLSFLWALAVWSFAGGAVSRVAAVGLAGADSVGFGGMARFAASKWRAYFSAPLFPLIGVLGLTVPLLIVGLLMRLNLGLLIAGLVWPLMLICGLLMTMALLGLAFGWPLMWATISTEGSDTFDALSRSFGYIKDRPLHFLFYVIVAVVIGTLGWILVSNVASTIIYLTYWAASWGTAEGQISLTGGHFQLALPGGGEPAHVGWLGAGLIGFWCGCVKMLAVGYLFGYFWTSSTGIYFLLRKDVDDTEMDEVFLEEDHDDQAYGLPPLTTDAAGAPIVDEEPAAEQNESDAIDEE